MPLSDEIQFFAATDVGRKRTHNEDNFLVDNQLGLYVVCDGMGGHAAGEVASALAVQTVHAELSRHAAALNDRATHGARSSVTVKQILGLMEYAVHQASARVHDEAKRDPKKRGMGTTCCALLILDSYAYVAHVGDSRMYLVRGEEIHQVTEDHTVANELIRLGMVTADEVHRVPRSNAITRAVGVNPLVEVDTMTLEVLPHDQFILASDGLTGYFETAANLLPYLREQDGERMVRSLIGAANERGGRDNITAVVVRLGGGDAHDDTRAKLLKLKREVLAGMPLFYRLSERELMHVMNLLEVQEFQPGDVVMREGELGDSLYIMLKGGLSITKGEQVLHQLGPGEHLGEMALIRSVPRSATVTASEPSELVCLKRDDFFEIIRTEPEVAVKLLWQFLGVLADRLERTSQDLSQARDQEARAAAQQQQQAAQTDPFAARRTTLGDLKIDFDPEGSYGHAPSASSAPVVSPSVTAQGAFSHGAYGQPVDSEQRRSTLPRPSVVPSTHPPAPYPPQHDPGVMRAPPSPSTMPSAGAPPGPPPSLRPPRPPGYGSGPPPHFAGGGETLPSARAAPNAPSPHHHPHQEDLAATQVMREDLATVPDGARRLAEQQAQGHPPLHGQKATVPLDPPQQLREELDELRREFQERLRKSREGRGDS